jgi:hypothetical protein
MALSEEDQRKFDEIESGLLEQAPVFSTTTIDRLRRRRRWAAVASFCVGILLLVAGLVWTQASLVWGVLMSVAGLLVMIGVVVQSAGRRRRR